MSSGINGILLRLAQSALEKQAQGEGFVPAPPPGGGPGGTPPGAPPGMDPSMMAAQGMPPAEMLAQMGAQVDPAMAAAGGASVPPPPMPGGDPAAAAGGAPMGAPPIDPSMQAAIDGAVQKAMGGAPGAGGKGGAGGAKNQMQADIAEIKSLLNKVLGVMVGAGKLPATELGDMGSQTGEGVPPEQKVAHYLGSVVQDEMPAANQERVSNALADLIISLKG